MPRLSRPGFLSRRPAGTDLRGGDIVNGIFSTASLWFASRATGVVALVLLTVVMVLGIAVNRHGRLPGLPRFAVTSLHRAVALLALAFLAIHIGTAIADPFVSIGIAASVIPFVSQYQPFWLGIGAVSIDLMLALVITSLLRGRIGRRTWRVVHWLSYASWPVAVAHSIGSGPDLWRGSLLDLTLVCIAATAAAVAWRVIGTRRETSVALRTAQVLTAVSVSTAPDGQPRGGPSRHTETRPKAGAR
jgi:sulfoxide reductase heme-binding subunit YedZ